MGRFPAQDPLCFFRIGPECAEIALPAGADHIGQFYIVHRFESMDQFQHGYAVARAQIQSPLGGLGLKEMDEVTFVELDATLVRDEEAFEKEVERCLALEEECIRSGKTVCCYTTRALITADTGNKEDDLRLSVRISDAVQSLVGRLTVTPAFVIAKGGITSSDVGTKALAVKKANVLGQIRPGIPVWQTGDESTFPKTPYVIFPGNVGEATTLREAVEILLAK